MMSLLVRVSASFLISSSAVAATNLLQNPGFETKLTSWNSWGGKSSAVAAAAYTGAYGLRISGAAGGRAQPASPALTVGAAYHLSAYARLGTNNEPAWIGIEFDDGSGNALSNVSVPITSTTFKQYSLPFVVPANAVNSQIYAWKDTGANSYADFDVFALAQDTVLAPTPSPSPTPGSSRNVLQQPFSSTSIWNMPIGSSAIYVAANLPGIPQNNSGSPMPMIDEEHIVLSPTSPLTNVQYNGAGWNGGNRCTGSGAALMQVPMPANYIVPNSGNNDCATFLLADGRSLLQSEPLARCSASESATSLVTFPSVDIYGSGIPGAHGGSGLSAIGGSLRIGELRPGQTGPRHALKVIVDAASMLYKCKSASSCYRWPATQADDYAVGYYGSANGNQNSNVVMGSLLAIPATTDLTSLGLESGPGMQLAYTLQNYGAYIVDDLYSPGFGFATENGPAGSLAAQFKGDYGYAITATVSTNSAWSRDIQRLLKSLSVVSNNSATSIGGGGSPRVPLAPPVSSP